MSETLKLLHASLKNEIIFHVRVLLKRKLSFWEEKEIKESLIFHGNTFAIGSNKVNPSNLLNITLW